MSMEDMLAAVVRIKGLQQDLPMHPSATTWAPDALAAIVLAMASEDYKFAPQEHPKRPGGNRGGSTK